MNSNSWRWLDELQAIGYGHCLTAVERAASDDVLITFGVIPETVAWRDPCELADWLDDEGYSLDSPIARAAQIDNWVFVMETNSFRGSQPDVLAGLSVNGNTISYVFQPGNIEFFRLYERGSLLTGFESPLQRQGSSPDLLLAAMSRLGLPADGTVGTWSPGYGRIFVELLRSAFGLNITEDIVSGPLLTGVVAEHGSPLR